MSDWTWDVRAQKEGAQKDRVDVSNDRKTMGAGATQELVSLICRCNF